jgi:hypothetical protein
MIINNNRIIYDHNIFIQNSYIGYNQIIYDHKIFIQNSYIGS